jgi:hypothetical protein
MMMVLFGFTLEATESDYSKMINTVNNQKVLTQQILKEYAFSGMGNNFGNSVNKLNGYIDKYNEEAKALETSLVDADAKKYLAESQALWIPIEKIFREKADKTEVAHLQNETDKILVKMSAIMTILLSKSSESKYTIVNISGYQGVIIERMAALYMMKTWGVSDPKFDFKMKESITFFTNSLHKMLKSNETTLENKKAIERVMRSFNFFEIMNRSHSRFIPTLIYDKTKKIHIEIDNITKSYIKEGK